ARQFAVEPRMAEPGEIARAGAEGFQFEIGAEFVALQLAASQMEVVRHEADAPPAAVPILRFLRERGWREQAQDRGEGDGCGGRLARRCARRFQGVFSRLESRKPSLVQKCRL